MGDDKNKCNCGEDCQCKDGKCVCHGEECDCKECKTDGDKPGCDCGGDCECGK